MTQIPIPVISSKTQKKFVDIADIIIDKSKRLYKNKKRDINKLINNYNFETVKTLNNVITNNYKKIYKGRAKKVGEMKVDLKNDWAIIHSNDRELFKFKIENEHKAEYLKLYLESLSDEKIAKIDDRTGKIIEKVLSIEIPGYNEDHKIKSLIEEWRQIKEEIDFLEKKVVEIDKEIDQMVYDLYDLTQEEIDIVENNSN